MAVDIILIWEAIPSAVTFSKKAEPFNPWSAWG